MIFIFLSLFLLMSKQHSSSKSKSKVILLIQRLVLSNQSTLLLFQTWLFAPLSITALKAQCSGSFCTLASFSKVRLEAIFYSHTLFSTSITLCFGLSAFKVQMLMAITVYMYGWIKFHMDRWFFVRWRKLPSSSFYFSRICTLAQICTPTLSPVATSWDLSLLS